jgi:hypothetical protein
MSFYIIVGVSVTYKFQIKNSKIKLLTEYKNVTQEVLFGNAVLSALMTGRNYDDIPQESDYSKESNERTLIFRNKVPFYR